MKKRIFALALALCMMLSVMPTASANGILTVDNGTGFTGSLTLDNGSGSTPNGVLTLDNGTSGRSNSTPSSSAPTTTVTTRSPGASSSQPYNVMPTDDDGDTGNATPAQRVENAGVETIKELKKDASGNPVKDADGNYIIRLEAWVTGTTTTTTTTTTTPMDIVLVLDQSGSMAYDFNGSETNTNTARRQYAMKQAVNNFIDEVAKQYEADTADHRMAIVTFGSSASTLQGWTFVNSAGKDTLKSGINGLPASPSGATNVAAGMTQAQSLLTNDGYTGENKNRQEVVIVFTDGVPTTSTDFDTTVATTAIAAAKAMKDDKVKVYTIGIFNGVDKTQLHGEKWDYEVWSDITCSGDVGSYWGGSWLNSLIGSNDFAGIDIAAGNRFLNYLSSNFPTATGIGVNRGTYHPGHTGLSGGTGYEITQNFNRDSSDYYLTATDSESLNAMFTKISQTIQSGSATVKLDSTTTVTDVVSDYFKLPAGVDANNGIKVYTAAYTKNGTWGADESSSLKPTVSGDTVTVTGFDFSANYCDKSNGRQDAANPDKPGNFYGRKLIIEIPIVASDDFLGGEDIPTNTTGSQIKNGDTVVEEFESPTINVPVDPSKVDLNWSTDVTVSNQTIYLSNAADLRAMVSIPGTSLIDGINNKFVTVSFVIGDATYTIAPGKTTGTWTGTYNVNPRECTDYTVTCYIDGVAVTNEGESNTATATVHVLKPSAEFLDTVIYLSDTPNYDDNKATADTAEVIWTDTTAGEAIKGTVANVVGGEPGMTFVCTPNGNFTDCTSVDVDIKIAGNVEFENSFMVHVLKPTVTVKDSTIYLGETPDYDSENLIGSVRWDDEKHDPSDEVIGTKPRVELKYDPEADEFEKCTDVSVDTVLLNDKGNYVKYTTFLNDGDKTDDIQFTVHVLKPVVEFQDSTIYLGYEPTDDDFEDYNIVKAGVNHKITWTHTKDDGSYTEDYDYPDVTFAFDTKGADYTDCTPVSATVYSDGLKSHDGNFTVHVLKPSFSVKDGYIYQGQTKDLTECIVLSSDWSDEGCETNNNIVGTKPEKDNFIFSVDGVEDVEAFAEMECTDLTVTGASINEKDAIAYFTKADFTVHVLKPTFTVNTTDLWADYGTEVDLYHATNTDAVVGVQHTWIYTGDCEGENVHPTELPTGAPEITLNEVTFVKADTDEVETYDVGTSDGTVTVNSVKYTNDAIGEMETDTDLIVKKKGEADNTVTIHVNKFDLTINKTWKDGEKDADGTYKQDAIFTVAHADLGIVQIVLPSDQSSVTVSGLLCGQEYTVKEDSNWTWRWNSEDAEKEVTGDSHEVSASNPHDTTEDHSNPMARGEKTAEFVNTLVNRLWLSFCTFVRNICGKDAIWKGGRS